MKSRAVALDSNLLLLYIVGSAAPSYIAKHKRLHPDYTEGDFHLLVQQLSSFSVLILTPNTVSETSNLIDHIGNPARSHIYQVLRELLASLPAFEERYVSSVSASNRLELAKLGITDCVLLTLCSEGIPLLTVDLQLYLAASRFSKNAVNFHHLREAQFESERVRSS